MSGDRRLWGKFALDMPDHPKIAGLSDAAFRCFTEVVLYSRRMLTDGFVEERLALKRWGESALEELCTNDPERPSLTLGQDAAGRVGYFIHDFADHQDTAAEVDARRARNAANGAKGGRARAAKTATHLEVLTQSPTEPSSHSLDDGLSPFMQRYATSAGLNDVQALVRRIAECTGRDVTNERAIGLARSILDRKPGQPPASAMRYVLAAIQQSPFEVQQEIDGSVVA